VHDNGVGQMYYDCGRLGAPGDASTYTLTQAIEAAGAFAPGASTAHQSCAPYGNAVVVTDGTNWVTWIYSGQLAGYVLEDTAPTCPDLTNGATTWT
jgi:hypothetical protein